MHILWKYLKPYKWLAFVSMLLAALAQALNFLDPVIFGKILDRFVINPGSKTEQELVTGVLWLLASLLPYLLLQNWQRLSRNMF